VFFARIWLNHSPRKTLPGATQITPENLAKTCAELASNKKAEDIVVLDLRATSIHGFLCHVLGYV
jgi:hypothetical protein